VLGMLMVAAAVFAADLAAVVAIVASLWLERSLGISHGLILDLAFVVAVSYGVAAWAAGKWMERELNRWRRREATEPTEHAHDSIHAHSAR
jgi:hypothetical protein